MKNQTVLRTESNGIEFFTVVATGESAVSIRGLARMSGVPFENVRRWFSDLTHTGVPKWLKPLQTLSLDLTHEVLTLPCLKAKGFLLHSSSLGLFLTPCFDTSTSTHGLPDRVWNDLTNSFSLSYTMSHVAEHCRW
jgi:hypothetical protein